MSNDRVSVAQYRERAQKVADPVQARDVVEGIRDLLAREFSDDLHKIGFDLAKRFHLKDLIEKFQRWRRSDPKRRPRTTTDYGPALAQVEAMESRAELEAWCAKWQAQVPVHRDSFNLAARLGVALLRLDRRDEADNELRRALELTRRSDLPRPNPAAIQLIQQLAAVAASGVSAATSPARRGAPPGQPTAEPTAAGTPDAKDARPGEHGSVAQSGRRRIGTLGFSARFMSRPAIGQTPIQASQLAGPVVVSLDSAGDEVRAPVEYSHHLGQVDWSSVRQLASLPGSVRCPVLQGGGGAASLFVGAWLIPLSVFGPGTALGREHRTLQLFPQGETALWKECRLEPLADDEGWLEGWFFAVEDPLSPGRRRYAVRTRQGAWLRWEFMSFARQLFVPPVDQGQVRFKPGFARLGASLVATEVDLGVDPRDVPRVFSCEVRRQQGLPPFLLVGALALPVFPDLKVRDDESRVEISVTIQDSGVWTVWRPGSETKASPADARPSPIEAAFRICMAELGSRPGGEGKGFAAALADLKELLDLQKVARASEEFLANEASRIVRARSENVRLPELSAVIAALLTAPARRGQGGKRDPWRARWSLTMTHLLAGDAFVTRSEGGLTIGADPVATLFQQYPEFPLSSAFLRDTGSALWLALVDLGNLGYRLLDLKLYTGCCSVDLQRIGAAADPELPALLRLAAQYGRSDEVHANVREILRAAPTESARALVFCVEDPEAPGVSRFTTASRAVAILESAAYDCPSGLSDEAWARRLAANAQTYLSSIPNPMTAFAEEARSLSPTQFIPRPALLADLQNALEARQEALGVFSMRKVGKTAAAVLLSTTFRFEHHYVNLGEEDVRTEETLDGLIARIDGSMSGQQRKPLLILDEFDTFCRQLCERVPRSTALHFLKWVEDHARRHPVLCIGLDPTALASVYPESNPLQTLRLFQLPYFTLAESCDFATALGRQLIVPEETVRRAFTLSGGHPVVMLNLFRFALSAALGFPASSEFVPRNTMVDFTDDLWDALQSEIGAPFQDPLLSRYRALQRVLETQKSRYGSIHDPWLLVERLAHLPDDRFSMQTIADTTQELLRSAATDPSRPPAEVIGQLLRWGLLRRTQEGDYEIGIPLLRVELTRGQWKCRRPS